MANSPTDNGKQIITFKYQQEGTAQGFNKILHGILPRGVISGGELVWSSNSEVKISPMQMLIGDSNVTAHVETTEDATVTGIGTNEPFIVATYSWQNITNSYVNFQTMDWTTVKSTPNVVVLGKCEFTGGILNQTFDYTRKTWTSAHYNNDFGFLNQNEGLYYPSFAVTPDESGGVNTLLLNIEKGNAIINGKFVSISSQQPFQLYDDYAHENSSNYFERTLNYSRKDILVINSEGGFEYIMGVDSSNPIFPPCPSNCLVIAQLEFSNLSGNPSTTIQTIKGTNITYVFNNNHIGGTSTVGKKIGKSTIKQHTLFI